MEPQNDQELLRDIAASMRQTAEETKKTRSLLQVAIVIGLLILLAPYVLGLFAIVLSNLVYIGIVVIVCFLGMGIYLALRK